MTQGQRGRGAGGLRFRLGGDGESNTNLPTPCLWQATASSPRNPKTNLTGHFPERAVEVRFGPAMNPQLEGQTASAGKIWWMNGPNRKPARAVANWQAPTSTEKPAGKTVEMKN